MKKKLLYLLSGNLSTTPRALQSILTASQNYDVQVIAVNRSEIWQRLDKELAIENKINIQWVSLTRKPFSYWLFGSIIHFLSRFFYRFFKNSLLVNSFASSKASVFLFFFTRRLNANFIIAHSSGSIFPAFSLAKKLRHKFSVDVEDYYPGENIQIDKKNEIRRREFILKQILPLASYISYASPLIGEFTLNLLTERHPKSILVNNCFSNKDFIFSENKNTVRLKLVWFSQNISYNRGLELIIPALVEFKNQISLCVIGNMDPRFYNDWVKNNLDCIEHRLPVVQNELHKMLNEFDIGVACEISDADLNRNIALTNKIFAYAQSGLYIIATNTAAQIEFIENNTVLGEICGQNEESFHAMFNFLIQKMKGLKETKRIRYDYAQRLAWEVESQKLMDVWTEI